MEPTALVAGLYVIGSGFTAFMARREGFGFLHAWLIAMSWPLGCVAVARRADKRTR